MTTESPLAACNLDNYDCPICHNTGYLIRTDENGIQWSRECECMKKRISLRNIEDSGLRELVSKYSFENYKTDDPEAKRIIQKAKEFIATDSAAFVVMGQSGSGKTHICTAICSALIEKGWRTKYFLWRTDAAALKSMVNEGERYQEELNKLKNVPVLYIDDLFKGSISEADKNLAFTMLNDRYNRDGKKTIISTELSISQIAQIDEAIAGRIAERARGYLLKAPARNWRLS